MNKQQEMQRYFDRSVEEILKQGRPCRGNSGNCRYRNSSNNTKCAIGHLIPDKKYKNEMEGFGISSLIIKDLVPSRWKRYESFFVQLQRAHDNSSESNFVHDFEINAKRVAEKYNLEYKF